jgi:hypothetical protein
MVRNAWVRGWSGAERELPHIAAARLFLSALRRPHLTTERSRHFAAEAECGGGKDVEKPASRA